MVTSDPAEVLHAYLVKKGYQNTKLASILGVSEGLIRKWVKLYDTTRVEFRSKCRNIGYDSPGEFIQSMLTKGISPTDQAFLLSVSPKRYMEYIDAEREYDGKREE